MLNIFTASIFINTLYSRKAMQIKRAMICDYKTYGFYWKYVTEPENISDMRDKLYEQSRKNDKIKREKKKANKLLANVEN